MFLTSRLEFIKSDISFQIVDGISNSYNFIFVTKNGFFIFDSKIDIFISRKISMQSILNALQNELESDPVKWFYLWHPFLTDRSESACRTMSRFWAHFNSCISVSDLQKISDVKVACVEPCVPKNIWNYICEFRRGMNFDENHPIWTE